MIGKQRSDRRLFCIFSPIAAGPFIFLPESFGINNLPEFFRINKIGGSLRTISLLNTDFISNSMHRHGIISASIWGCVRSTQKKMIGMGQQNWWYSCPLQVFSGESVSGPHSSILTHQQPELTYGGWKEHTKKRFFYIKIIVQYLFTKIYENILAKISLLFSK